MFDAPESERIEGLLRELAPRVLGALVSRARDFAAVEDAVQEAWIAADAAWRKDGLPENPGGWLYRVAHRRLCDHGSSEKARKRRESLVAMDVEQAADPTDSFDLRSAEERDDTLRILFTCCHPSLSAASAIALTLRAVGGLTTAQIASGFLVSEATMAQRISRAKETIAESDLPLVEPTRSEREERLGAVRHVLYLLFNEGYASSHGSKLQRVELATEAIRLARLLHRLEPEDVETTGLLSLMLLTDARRCARERSNGEPIPLEEQDRASWDRVQIAEGIALLESTFLKLGFGVYRIQASIAALHDEARTAGETPWPQILGLYEQWSRISNNPMVDLNRIVAAAMVHGPRHGLSLLAALEGDERISRHHRVASVRAHLLELAGDHAAAGDEYRAAAALATNGVERDHLLRRAAALARR